MVPKILFYSCQNKRKNNFTVSFLPIEKNSQTFKYMREFKYGKKEILKVIIG